MCLAYYRHRYENLPPESQEEFQSRVRRATEEQEQAAERRKRESAQRREQRQEERAKGAASSHQPQYTMLIILSERKAAEARQKAKASNKKAKAEASRKTAETKAREQLERSQTLRSAVFAAARSGDAQNVKKGIYEDHVDAAGGEVADGACSSNSC